MSEIDVAETIEAIVRAVPGVADLHSGMFGEVATHLPGRKVRGIRISDGSIEVHITVWSGQPVREIAADVRAAIRNEFPTATVDVTVEAVAVAPVASAD